MNEKDKNRQEHGQNANVETGRRTLTVIEKKNKEELNKLHKFNTFKVFELRNIASNKCCWLPNYFGKKNCWRNQLSRVAGITLVAYVVR